jgi:hypothetical protein
VVRLAIQLTINFAEDVCEFFLQHSTAGVGSGTRRGLCSQSSRPIQQSGDIVQSAIGNLQRAQSIIGVSHADGQDGNVRTKLVGNSQTSSVVARLVDAQAAGKAGQGTRQPNVGLIQLGLSIDRTDVINN